MAKITVGGVDFYILPETAAWSYSMKIQSFDTYNGRVIQLLACTVDSLSVEGYIPNHVVTSTKPNGSLGSFISDQWYAMEVFESNVKRIMAQHEKGGRAQSNTGKSVPAKFVFSEVGWNGYVYLTGYSDVRYEPDIPAVKYTLKFEIDSGFSEIENAASDQGLKNIPDGVGWVRNVYNTPETSEDSWSKFKSALENFVDDAGTHDASNPADWFQYLKEADEGDGDDGNTNSGTEDGKNDSDYSSTVRKVAQSVLEKLGAVGKSSGGGKF